MPAIVASAVARPPFTFTQDEIVAAVRAWLGPDQPRHERVLRTFATGLVRQRRSVVDLATVFTPRSFAARNADWERLGTELGVRAARACLRRAGVMATAVDHLVVTSCTGFAIPGFDAAIAHRLGMKRSVTRLPISAHGCAGGAVGLSHAAQALVAHPTHRALVVSIELTSLTFRPDDRSAENLISTGLFGDGAAAVMLDGRPRPGCPEIVATASRLYAKSAGLMGFRLTDTGLQVFLSKQVPIAIRAEAPRDLRAFLREHGLRSGDIRHWLVHPGGRRIVEGFEDALGLGPGGLKHTRAVLSQEGNLSSATVLVIIDRALRSRGADRPAPGDHGVALAFGPGFGAEMLLLRWPGVGRKARRRPT